MKIHDPDLYIAVSAAHIAEGVGYDPMQCPIALAVHAFFTRSLHHVYVEAGQVTIQFEADASSVIWQLPLAAQEFVSDFDDGKHVEPSRFTLTLEDSR